MSDQETGLYQKYKVTRTDGRDAQGEKNANCEYFVLDLTHDPFALAAIEAYADACEREYEPLAVDLRRKATQLRNGLPQSWLDRFKPASS